MKLREVSNRKTHIFQKTHIILQWTLPEALICSWNATWNRRTGLEQKTQVTILSLDCVLQLEVELKSP